MKIKESFVEDLIYLSPWLLNESYLIPEIKGSRGEYGRQVNIGNNNSRFIDLLFKDARDYRPVIVELKRGKIIRENIAQILEYRALIVSMTDDLKAEWEAEFGKNYYAPKMILIGDDIDTETMLSANLAGVDYRCFGKEERNELNIDFDEIKSKISDWNTLRKNGNRGLGIREAWIVQLINRTKTIVDNIGGGLHTIKQAPLIKENSAFFAQVFPFLNLPVFDQSECLFGLYEYFQDYQMLSEQHIYLEICIDQFYEEHDEKIEKRINLLLREFSHKRITMESVINPVFEINRSYLNDDEYEGFIKNTVATARLLQSEVKKYFGIH